MAAVASMPAQKIARQQARPEMGFLNGGCDLLRCKTRDAGNRRSGIHRAQRDHLARAVHVPDRVVVDGCREEDGVCPCQQWFPLLQIHLTHPFGHVKNADAVFDRTHLGWPRSSFQQSEADSRSNTEHPPATKSRLPPSPPWPAPVHADHRVCRARDVACQKQGVPAPPSPPPNR